MFNNTEQTSDPSIEFLPDIFRPIGPADDVVVSAEKVLAWKDAAVVEALKERVPEPPDSVVGHREDETPIEKLFVSFANEILAYSDRQEKYGNDILFIHSYVRRYKKRFEALMGTDKEKGQEDGTN